MVPTPSRLPVRDSQSPHSALWDRVGDLAACTFSHGNSTGNSGLCERASELHHQDLIDVLGLRITLIGPAPFPWTVFCLRCWVIFVFICLPLGSYNAGRSGAAGVRSAGFFLGDLACP